MEEESKLSFYLNKIIGIIIVSLLFTICSIPVFTIGASLTALNEAVMGDLENENADKLKIFQTSLRKNMNYATIIWLILLSGYAVFGGVAYMLSKKSGELMGVLLAVCVVFLSLITMIFMYVFPLQAHFNKSPVTQMKNALLLSVKCFPTTIILALLLAVLALVFYFKTDVFVILFAVIGFGAFAYIYDFFMLKCFKPYLGPIDDKKEKPEAHVNEEKEVASEKEEASENETDEKEKVTEKVAEAEDEEKRPVVSFDDSDIPEGFARKKSIELSDAAEDERKRVEAVKKAEEDARKRAEKEADLAARKVAKELAGRVKESTVYETTGENIYRRTAAEDTGSRIVNKKKKKK